MIKLPKISHDFQKEIELPADKSISHRALLLSSITKGTTYIFNLLDCNDIQATKSCLQKLGVTIEKDKNYYKVKSNGKFFPVAKKKITINAKESGTTMRILSGLLIGQKFTTIFQSSNSLKKRPMSRIIIPLTLMGANITGQNRNNEQYPPLIIRPSNNIKGIKYYSPISSAQVKSAILLAGLFAKNPSTVTEPYLSRDHTERILKLFSAKIIRKKNTVTIYPGQLKSPKKIFIPADSSSASFFIALTTLMPKSKLLIKNVNINPSRIGFINVIKRMGGKIRFTNKKNYFEPYSDIEVKSSSLKGTIIDKKEIPLMIDEIPILIVCAAYAKGKTIIRGVKELRVKETDRINSLTANLKKVGIKINVLPAKNDWDIIIEGIEKKNKLKDKIIFSSFNDHRTAMSLIIFSIISGKEYFIDNITCINKSFPGFLSKIKKIIKN